VAEGKVVTLGFSGILSCLDAASGKVVWRKQFDKDFKKTAPQFFVATSPIIMNGMCLAHVGGQGNGALIAFDLNTGDKKWEWAGEGPARYSTTDLVPLRAYAQQVFAATDAYLAGLAPHEASQTVDLTRLGQGRPTVAWVVSKFVVLELAKIYGELASVAESRPRLGQRSPSGSRLPYEPEHLAALGPEDRLDPGDLLPEPPSVAKLSARVTSET
jgi:hypothetical protein